MIYSLLIYETSGFAAARSDAEHEATLEAHRVLQEETKASGAYVTAVQLEESGAMTVRHTDRDVLVTDGPFAESKELFIGFYLFNCASLEEATGLAKRIPVSERGSVEVRATVWTDATAVTSA